MILEWWLLSFFLLLLVSSTHILPNHWVSRNHKSTTVCEIVLLACCVQLFNSGRFLTAQLMQLDWKLYLRLKQTESKFTFVMFLFVLHLTVTPFRLNVSLICRRCLTLLKSDSTIGKSRTTSVVRTWCLCIICCDMSQYHLIIVVNGTRCCSSSFSCNYCILKLIELTT